MGFCLQEMGYPSDRGWGAGSPRSAPGCFAPCVAPTLGCFSPQLQTLGKSRAVSANVQPGQATMAMLMGTTGKAESTPEFPQVSVSHDL